MIQRRSRIGQADLEGRSPADAASSPPRYKMIFMFFDLQTRLLVLAV